MTFIQFKIWRCVENVIEIRLFFVEIWWFNNFQNGGRPPSWNCFTTIQDHPQRLLLAAATCQISGQSDTQIWRYSYLNFSHIWIEMPQDEGFGGLWTAKNVIFIIETPKSTFLCKSASLPLQCLWRDSVTLISTLLLTFKLSTVKIRWGVWPAGELTESVMDAHTGKFIFCPCIALSRQVNSCWWSYIKISYGPVFLDTKSQTATIAKETVQLVLSQLKNFLTQWILNWIRSLFAKNN